jgi:hypothetical protein
MEEVDALSKMHASHDISTFNNDAEYKKLTAEAIDAKAFALKKIQFFVDSIEAAREDKRLLPRILARPFMDFAHPSTILELQTDASGFPWEQVTKQSASIDFRLWRPGNMSQTNVDIMIGAMSENSAMRQVSVGNDCMDRLFFTDGWKTKDIEWSSKNAVYVAPDIVSMLLRSCHGIITLDLRLSDLSPLYESVPSCLLRLREPTHSWTIVHECSANKLGSEGSKFLSIALGKLIVLENLDLRSSLPQLFDCRISSTDSVYSSNELGSEGAGNIAAALDAVSNLRTINLRSLKWISKFNHLIFLEMLATKL